MPRVYHSFTSAKSDGADATKVRASNWNADHIVDGTVTSAGLLGLKTYNPAFTDTTISNTTQADVDATNLVVTFTAPPSGTVLVRLTCSVYEASTSTVLYWGLREGSTNVAGPSVISAGNNSDSGWHQASIPFVITGLTPGSSHTYKWAAKRDTANGNMRYGDPYGAAVMEVWDAVAGGTILTGVRVIRGIVAPDGSIEVGTGFSVARPSTGHYTITFDAPFAAKPAVVVNPIYNNNEAGDGSTGLTGFPDQIAAGSVSVFMLDALSGAVGGAFQNQRFSFVAIESSTGADSNAPLASDRVDVTGGDITTTSSSFVDATGLSITLTTGARRCLVTFQGEAYATSGGDPVLTILVDGVNKGDATWGFTGASGAYQARQITYLTDVLSAGSHTFKVQWRVQGGGTGHIYGGGGNGPNTSFAVQEQAATTGATPSGAGSHVRLDYSLGSDINGVSISANTPYDLIANQSFVKASADSLISVSVRGLAFGNDSSQHAWWGQVVVDSGGTPITKLVGSAQNYNGGSAQMRPSPLTGAPVIISGLAAGSHTVKVQFVSSASDTLYLRASTVSPASGSGAEFLQVMVVEHDVVAVTGSPAPLAYELGADVTGVGTTFTDALSTTPPAGTYDIFWKVFVEGAGGAVTSYCRLLVGGTEQDYGETNIASGNRGTVTGFRLGVVLDGATIVKTQARVDTGSTSKIERNGGLGTNNKGTTLALRRVG